MNINQRLSYCLTCNRKEFNSKYGIVCSLTNESPQFENQCSEYDKNQALEQEFISKNREYIDVFDDLYLKRKMLLSSSKTHRAFIFSILVPLLPFALFIFVGIKIGFDPKIITGTFVSGLLLIIYPSIYSRMTIAEVRSEKLILRRLFGKEKQFIFSDIMDVSSFQLSRTNFVTIKIKNEFDKVEKFIIMNSKSLLSFEKVNAKKVLIALKNYDSLKRYI